LLEKKLPGNVITTVLAEVVQVPVLVLWAIAVAVVKEKIADCPVLDATRLAKGMVIDTAVTWLATPTVPVAEQTEV